MFKRRLLKYFTGFIFFSTFILICVKMQPHEPYYMRPQFFEMVDNEMSEKEHSNSLDYINNIDKVSGWVVKKHFLNSKRHFLQSYIEDANLYTENKNFTESIIMNYDPNNPPGHLGKAVVVDKYYSQDITALIEDGYEKHGFNQFVSDLISVERPLPDYRDRWCKVPGRFLDHLPQASVVICFHNEAWSTLIRTVQSVLQRSPEFLLKEIILIDDFSTMVHLKKSLDDYVKLYKVIKLYRNERREGLIRSRLIGTKYATAPVLVFLDSHCECTEGWLEALIDRIARNNATVVAPVVDIIDEATFEYIPQNSYDLMVGGFTWDLEFTWEPLSDSDLAHRYTPSSPLITPTISGGLLAIDKTFFEKLGMFDEGFEIWGRENLELSFKTWMCGGRLEIIPCSHVGHLFRDSVPYTGLRGSLKKNTIRLAKVWLDDYAKFVYVRYGGGNVKYGDITSRIELRKKLACKPFQWYLKTVYPELEVPNESIASGEIRSVEYSSMCLDSTSSPSSQHHAMTVYPCHGRGRNQFWTYSKRREIKQNNVCLDSFLNTVIGMMCMKHARTQIWEYDLTTKQIKKMSSQQCIEAHVDKENIIRVTLEKCSSSEKQKWTMQNYTGS